MRKEPVMAGLLPAIVDRLSRQYPKLALHIIEDEPPELQNRHLRNHDIDLMIGRLPSPTSAPDTAVQILLHESGVIVAGLNNPWARRRKIHLSELINERWCLPPRESFPGSWIADAFQACGLEMPRANVTVYSIQMQNALLSTGRFLSFLPATMLHFSAKRLSLKVLPVEMPVHMWPIGIVTLKGRTPQPRPGAPDRVRPRGPSRWRVNAIVRLLARLSPNAKLVGVDPAPCTLAVTRTGSHGTCFCICGLVHTPHRILGVSS
jgi:DNA-binding transcriptional LysR family regulator